MGRCLSNNSRSHMGVSKVRTLQLEQIVIPENRFRREFDEKKLEELKQSVLRIGLLNPPTVEFVQNAEAEGVWTLRAGERRLRVLQSIIKDGLAFRLGTATFAGGEVPAVDYDELTPLQRLEIEVEENVVRSDFTWQERDRAYAALHGLRKAQNPGQSITATASEILGKPAAGGQISSVADSIIIAKHLHIPEVAKAKSSKEALKVIQKIANAGHRAKLAAASLDQPAVHKLLKGDSLDLLSQLQPASFDVILTDPPYGVDADSFGDMAATGHAYEDSPEWYAEHFLKRFPDECYRVAKERAHAYVFCDIRWFDKLALLMLLAGWKVFPTPLIWVKGNGMLPFPDHAPRRTYECILYAWKGDRKTLVVKNDVIDISGVKKLRHGAQKPVALYCDLLSRSANPGDTVLDCFGGSGTILVAANRMNLTATYIEKMDDAFNMAQLRINEREIDDGAEEHDGLEDIPI